MLMKKYERVIMGIDPGTNVMGYGVLGVVGKKPEVIVMGVIQLSKFEDHYKRLHRIFERVSGLAEQYLPDEVMGTVFYEPSENGYEAEIRRHMDRIKSEAEDN